MGLHSLEMIDIVGERRGRRERDLSSGRTRDQMEVCLDDNGFCAADILYG